MFVGGAAQTKILGLTGTFSMLVILGIVVIMSANKFFSLIHYCDDLMKIPTTTEPASDIFGCN